MSENESRPHRSKGTIVKLALAGVAVVGIGAAITTAAWTDDVFFRADATTGSFRLEGALSPAGPWESASTPEVAIEVPHTVLRDLIPNTVRSFDFYIRNIGVSEVFLTATVASEPDDEIFGDSPICPADVVFTGVPTSLGPDFGPDSVSGPITVTVTADDWPNDNTCQDLVEPKLFVKVTGTPEAP